MEFILAPFWTPFVLAPFAGLLWTAFWIWMLVDAILREEHEYPGHWSSQRLVWVLAIVLVNPVAVVYLFAVFAKVRRGNRATSTQAAPSVGDAHSAGDAA